MLPLDLRVNRKAWVTSELFMDWIHTRFIPQVKRYLAGKKLSFKVLLLLDNAHGHPTDLTDVSSSHHHHNFAKLRVLCFFHKN